MTKTRFRQFADAARSKFYQWVPHPLLTVMLVFLWLALQNSFSAGNIVVAIILSLTLSAFTSSFWPNRPKISKPWLAIRFITVLLYDVLVANIQVAKLILFKRSTELRSGWVVMPMLIRSPEAITSLMATITLTPGTVSSDISEDGNYLLIHCLDIDNADAIVSNLKNRYEKKLVEIFP